MVRGQLFFIFDSAEMPRPDQDIRKTLVQLFVKSLHWGRKPKAAFEKTVSNDDLPVPEKEKGLAW